MMAEAWPCRCATALRCSLQLPSESSIDISLFRLFGSVHVFSALLKQALHLVTSKPCWMQGEAVQHWHVAVRRLCAVPLL